MVFCGVFIGYEWFEGVWRSFCVLIQHLWEISLVAILFVRKVLCGMDAGLMNESAEGSDSALWAVVRLWDEACGAWGAPILCCIGPTSVGHMTYPPSTSALTLSVLGPISYWLKWLWKKITDETLNWVWRGWHFNDNADYSEFKLVMEQSQAGGLS